MVIETALNCCIPYMENNEHLKAPSNCIKLKYDIRRLVLAKWALLVKNDQHRVDAKEMKRLMVLLKIVSMIRKYHNHKPQTTRGIAMKSDSTITKHQEDKPSKATNSLFPIKMTATLEWTQSNVQQNIEQLQTPTMGVTINEKPTKTEPLP